MSSATHCIPWDWDCSICNPAERINPDGYWGDDPGPSVEELAAAVASGLACKECDTRFVKAHGAPTVCSFCARRLLETECGVKLAIYPEVNRTAHRAEAEKRKTKRNAK